MYLEHFGLKRSPFKITPDTSLFYTGSKRGAALEALKYAIVSGEGIIKVVGEVGSGKTMLCRMLEMELPDNIEVVYIANPSLSPENILHVIAFELKLDISSDTNKFEVMQQLQNYLLAKHADNKQVVVFVEEAQSMPLETLEEIRLLSNLETNDHKLLQMVLFGQPELDEKLRDTSIRQLKERITHSFYLDPFPKSDIFEYLNFRMRHVGYKGPDIFSQKVASNIERKSKGLTRRINILADKALLAVYSEGGHGVAAKHIDIAARDSDFNQEKNWKPLSYSIAAVCVVALAVWTGTLIPQQHAVVERADELAIKPAATAEILKPATLMPAAVEAVAENNQSNQNSEPAQQLLQQQLAMTKAWLPQAEAGNYTIQLILLEAWAVNKAEDYLRKASKTLNMDKVYVYDAIIQGQKVFSVLYNDYINREDAIQQLQKLSSELKASSPYLRTIKGIRADIRKSQSINNMVSGQ
ncbi:MAG: AAA family ATPase [Gammaproteobacteria bacterium]|nr:AAA family ATPase [Gammaproteobacteria bacterium]